MILNEIDITDLVYGVVDQLITPRISGKTYHKNCRPTNSKKEDAEVVFSAADTKQLQDGFVYVNVYTKDVDCGAGRKVLNRPRISQMITWGAEIADELNKKPHYKWRLDEASRVVEEPGTAEHFVSFKLKFTYYSL